MDRFTTDMMSNLYGNPHAASPSSQRSTARINNARSQLLRFLNADPDDFELVFTANATAAIKLVGEGLRALKNGFCYGYHKDAHTSLVGLRELAKEQQCLASEAEVEQFFANSGGSGQPRLFAYPAQSNMDGRRLPLKWCRKARNTSAGPTYTLLDAAALLSTSKLDLSDSESAPDFTGLSLSKIFGFPDLGALVVRKKSGWLMQKREYFGGGTVDMVVSLDEQWHARKSQTLHDGLEDGTLPIHNIVAVSSALATHRELYQSLDRVSRHTSFLADRLYRDLQSLKHDNGLPVARIYNQSIAFSDAAEQGPIVAFNLLDRTGSWVSNHEFEKLAAIKNINIRTGGLCNPGGVATALDMKAEDMRTNYAGGQRCDADNDVFAGRPTGVIRASLGAMSTLGDVQAFKAFLTEFFVDNSANIIPSPIPVKLDNVDAASFYVESLTVYPIKSCAGWTVPSDTPWLVKPEGLAWDREWCLLHQGTNKTLSQKRYPKMALIKPEIDLADGVMRVRAPNVAGGSDAEISISLYEDLLAPSALSMRQADVCGDALQVIAYASPEVNEFFSNAIGVPCRLARFPAATASSCALGRHSKADLMRASGLKPGIPEPILLSNESPILTITRSSLNRLNEAIKARSGKAALPSVFRANILLAEPPSLMPGLEQPYAEDRWQAMLVGDQYFEFLGGCRRCQMVCVDQVTAEKNEEPFVTLAKTRRIDGKVLFGVHTCHVPSRGGPTPTIRVGDVVRPLLCSSDERTK